MPVFDVLKLCVFRRSAWALWAAILFCGKAHAEFVTVDVKTDAANYTVGDTVNWSIEFSVGGSTPATNFGLASLALDLRDSFGETLSPGVINPASFPTYLLSGGTFDINTQTLLEVGVLQLSQNGFSTVAKDGDQLTGLLLATGSYVVNVAGGHNLVPTLGSQQSHFTAEGQSVGDSMDYSPVNLNSASFNVAVPEPASLTVLLFAGASLLLRRHRA